MPEESKSLIGVSDASYLRPLWYGLRNSSEDLDLVVDIPAQLAIKLQQRTDNLRCAFLSPIDYARHGGDYAIVPGIAVSSVDSTRTIQLFINPDVRDIETLAVDIRVTSEIILAKIILAEKYPNREVSKRSLQFLPMMPNRAEMLQKADAALVVNLQPTEPSPGEPFALDLVEEWYDMTGLPYVHGCWVGHEGEELRRTMKHLARAKEQGVASVDWVIETLSQERNLSRQFASQYLSSFSFEFGEPEQQGMTEFMKYAYFHGILPDVPDLNFFEAEPPQSPLIN